MPHRTILKTIFEPFVVFVAAVYFIIDALVLSILKLLFRKIANLRLFKFIGPWIASLRPYPTLALFVVPLIFLEPVKPFSAYLIASGHFILGTLALVLGEVLKITIVERIFYIGRKKLMTIRAFAWIFNFASRWLTWFKTLPPWRAVKQSVDGFMYWAHKLNHDSRARGFL